VKAAGIDHLQLQLAARFHGEPTFYRPSSGERGNGREQGHCKVSERSADDTQAMEEEEEAKGAAGLNPYAATFRMPPPQ
jgi:hypothetical protein